MRTPTAGTIREHSGACLLKMSSPFVYPRSLAIVSSTRYAYELQHEKSPLVDPVVNRPNLIVFSGGLVTRLALEETSDVVTARGVYVSFPDGSERLARLAPGGEVIMSAGVVRTPQLLELSGIGNRGILEKFNISVQLDLPAVGENYEDQ